MDTISLEFPVKLNFRDYLLFNLWFMYRKFIIKLVTFVGLVYVPSLIFAIVSLKDGVAPPTNILSLGGLGVFITVLIPASIYYQSRRVFSSDKLAQVGQNYSFNPAGITIESESGIIKVNWDQVYKIYDCEHYLYIFISRIKALIIPKSLIVDKYQDVRAMIVETIPQQLKNEKSLKRSTVKWFIASIAWIMALGTFIFILKSLVP